MNIELILKYFPEISEEQRRQFEMLYDLYADWNAKINVISSTNTTCSIRWL